MKKRALSLLLVGAMCASLLAGCGSSTKDEAASTGETTATEDTAATTEAPAADTAQKNPVTIKTVSMFGGTDPNATVYEAINEEFMKQYDYITVEDNSQSSDEDWKASVAADFAVGNEPDVIQFFTDATASTILATDKFVSLNEILAAYPEYAKDTLDSALEAVTNPDGVRRAVPTTGYWEGLYCNKDLFDQYKVALPTDWDSLVAAINTFKENGIIPIACSLNNVPHYWVEFLMLYAAGEESYGTVPESAPQDWAKGLEALKTLRDMGAFPEDTDTVDDAYTGQLFKDKKAAMQLDGSWYAGGITDTENTVVIAFPGIKDQKAKSGAMVGGISSGFYITKKAWADPDKREAAVKFVEAHTCKSAVQRYWEAGGAISKAAVQVDAIDGMTNLAISALEYTNAATSINAPTDSRLGQEPYAVIISNAVKISTGAVLAEDVLNEALGLYAQRNQ
ncbi:MAG: raffinose/stachyose/melibiose transport system substrate-binding protein [Clostridiales bacterium]|nr:raffinose/stachyose/melibiose transport system substrate-binding protein [Clostridiales bacterium]